MRIQGWHIIVLLVVILLLFGANRLPDLARSVGQSLKIFKNEVKDLRDDPADRPSDATQAHDPYRGTTPGTTDAPPSVRPTDGDRPTT